MIKKLSCTCAVLLLLAAFYLTPSIVLAAHEEDLNDLKQRVSVLEGAKKDGPNVDFGGFIRFRYHLSNFTNFSNTGDFQVQPPDKSVKDADNAANYFEQRARLYVSPKFGDYVTGVFAFEIDYRLGDSAYGVKSGLGGGLEADQVNLETKNLYIDVKIPGTNHTVLAGLQNLKDPYNGILLGWADAGGLTFNYVASKELNMTAGFYRFWQPTARLKKSVAADFFRGEVAYSPSKDLELGFNFYALLDRTGAGATAGDPGALGGPDFGSSSNGFAPTSYNVSTGHESLVGNTDYRMNMFWPGVNFKYNNAGYTLDGFFIYGGGKFESGTPGVKDVTVNGYAANLSASTKVGSAKLKLNGLYVSGDNKSGDNPSIGIKKRGFYTPGSWSLASSWMGLTGMKIIFPDIDATNQDQYLVYDATNTLEQRPLGVMALMLTGDIPLGKKTTLEGGIGVAASAKKRAVNNESYMATEVNVGVHHALWKNVSVGLVGAYAFVGNFYEVTGAQAAAFNTTKVGNPVQANLDPADMYRLYARMNYSF